MIIFLVIAVLTAWLLCYLWQESEMGAFVIWIIIWCLVHLITWWVSYSGYVTARTFYDITKEQYSESIVMYENKAVLNINENSFTDMKYTGYQENMADMIKTLRKNVVKYNTLVNKKRIYGKNLFFSWYIVKPDDDMRSLTLREVK
jgi:membrane-bound metal-dependent hydrolase YbcI (DUF457 family)